MSGIGYSLRFDSERQVTRQGGYLSTFLSSVEDLTAVQPSGFLGHVRRWGFIQGVMVEG